MKTPLITKRTQMRSAKKALVDDWAVMRGVGTAAMNKSNQP
jgi:hypothetical protein